MKLPNIIRDALSHRCGCLNMEEANDDPPVGEQMYWYMYDGHAEIVKAWISEFAPDSNIIYMCEATQGDQWDATRPIQISLLNFKEADRRK